METKASLAGIVQGLAPVIVAGNLFMIAAGTWSLINPPGSGFDRFLDTMMLATPTLNVVFAMLGHLHLNHRNNKQASRVQWLFSAYLVGLGILVAANVGTTLSSTLGFNPGSPQHTAVLVVSVGLNCIVHVFPAVASIKIFIAMRPEMRATTAKPSAGVFWSANAIKSDPSWEFKPSFKKVLKVIGVALILLLFALATATPLVFVPGGDDWRSFIAGDVATTMLFLLVPCTFMLLRHVPRASGKVNRILKASIAISGCVLFGINALPLLQTGIAVQSLDAQFATSYGPSWQSSVPASPYRPYRADPVSVKDIFYTIPLEPVDQQLDIPYMVDKGKALMFDWYAPKGIMGSPDMLPLVVAIHGGSWRLYDKGVSNNIPTSKYIASLGYVVVDVQYGLYDDDDADPFTIKDMVTEIANLTRFIAEDGARFHADVTRTFFLGRSAGAHLALVCGLGHDEPYFAGNFSAGFDCVGVIPFYPPTNMTRWFDDASTAFFGVPSTQFRYFNPVDLAGVTSPHVLCFQGLADTLVPPSQARQLKAVMESAGRTCIVGEFPHAGHAFDIFYNYQYNQVCMYYIERFLALQAL